MSSGTATTFVEGTGGGVIPPGAGSAQSAGTSVGAGAIPDPRSGGQPPTSNPPGQPALSYRIGTHGAFLQRMLKGLWKQRVPDDQEVPLAQSLPLIGLSEQGPSDPSIALLDAWATVADVLTFYQERIANECFLRTATELRSVRQLARMVGYELKPGLGASTYLSFLVDEAKNAPKEAVIPAGTKVQSLPQRDQLPQIFETGAAFRACQAWNSLRPVLLQPARLVVRSKGKAEPEVLYVPLGSRLDALEPYPGAVEVTELLLRGIKTGLRPGDMLVLAEGDVAKAVPAYTVVQETELEQTRVRISAKAEPQAWPRLTLPGVLVKRTMPEHRAERPPELTRALLRASPALRVEADARPELRTELPINRRSSRGDLRTAALASRGPAPAAGPASPVEPSRPTAAPELSAKNVQTHIYNAHLDERDLQSLLRDFGWEPPRMQTVMTNLRATAAPSPGRVFALRTRTGIFGAAAPRWEMLPRVGKDKDSGGALLKGPDPYKQPWDGVRFPLPEEIREAKQAQETLASDEPRKVGLPTIWTNSQGVPNPVLGRIYLDRSVPGIAPGSWIVLETEQNGVLHREVLRVNQAFETAQADYGLTGQVTAVDVDLSSHQPYNFQVRTTSVYVVSEPLELAPLPIDPAQRLDDELPWEEGEEEDEEARKEARAEEKKRGGPALRRAGGARKAGKAKGGADEDEEEAFRGERGLVLDRMVIGLSVGQPIVLRAEHKDTRGLFSEELLFLRRVSHHAGYTLLFFNRRLRTAYVRESLQLCANIVPATHGETVHEVLGSGNGSQSRQRFVLKKPPLTYVPDGTYGSRSTLQLRINGVLWSEAAWLFQQGQKEAYEVRHGEGGLAEIRFGDGAGNGARLPSGFENVVATYRSGLGPAGELPSGALTQLLSRPAGIKEVTNPVPATGAAPPESIEHAKRNAPRALLTLSRIVSPSDYTDFVEALPGIGKARAGVIERPLPPSQPGLPRKRRVVVITIASATGSVVPEDSELYRAVTGAIEAQRDPGQGQRVPVQILSFQGLHFNLLAHVRVNPRYRREDVFGRIRELLIEEYSFERRAFGQAVHWAEMTALIHQRVAGVDALRIDALWIVPLGAKDDAAPGSGVKAPGEPESTLILRALEAGWDYAAGTFRPAQLLLLNPRGITLKEWTLPGEAQP